MTVKEYLNQIRDMDIRISQRQKQLEELRILAFGDKSPAIDKPQIQTSPAGDILESAVIKYVDLDKEINDLIDEYVNTKNRIIHEIHRLNNPKYVELLHKRYVDYMSLEDIASEMNYSHDRIRHLHGNALEAFRTKVLNDLFTAEEKSTHNSTFTCGNMISGNPTH